MSGQRKYPAPEAGAKYGRLTVLGANELREQSVGGPRCTWWLCECACGLKKWVRQINLVSGRTSGCSACQWRSDDEVALGLCPPEHRRRLINRIYSAIDRCTNPMRPGYSDYGGRGITIYAPWLERPAAFLDHLVTLEGWDDPKLTIDRIDNSLGYRPGNLRFVTMAIQRENRRARRKQTPVDIFYTPKVILVGRPTIIWDAVDELLLEEYGLHGGASIEAGEAWTVSSGATDAEAICELFGRGCYGSFGERQGRKGARDYFAHILEAGHGSVLENASFSFVVTRGSRGLMAQMTRHRAGFAWAIESTHFIDYSDTARASLAGLPENIDLRKHSEASMRRAVTDYAKAWEMAEGETVKKKATAAAVRGLLPTALESKMGFTANLRALRHFAELRGAEDNVPEIRMVAAQIARIMMTEAPAIFQDFSIGEGTDGHPVVKSEHRKV